MSVRRCVCFLNLLNLLHSKQVDLWPGILSARSICICSAIASRFKVKHPICFAIRTVAAIGAGHEAGADAGVAHCSCDTLQAGCTTICAVNSSGRSIVHQCASGCAHPEAH